MKPFLLTALLLPGLAIFYGAAAQTPAVKASVTTAPAAKYSTRTGTISFFSATPIEDISARNAAVVAMLDLNKASVAFLVPMAAFQFKNSLMQTHFNENYVESGKYPTAMFSGQLLGLPTKPLQAGEAPQPVQVEGDLTIHNVKRRVHSAGTVALQPDGRLLVQSKFSVAPADYNIEIPLLVRGHIAQSVEVTVNLSCPATQPVNP